MTTDPGNWLAAFVGVLAFYLLYLGIEPLVRRLLCGGLLICE